MRKLLAVFVGVLTPILVVAQTPPAATPPVRIVFDTDMDSDCDDVAALAILHVLADRGEAEILATVVSSKNPWSAPCVDAINTWYGRGDLPIGGPHSPKASRDASRYAQQLAQRFPQDISQAGELPHAASIYRDTLKRQPDKSVVVLTVGDLTNVAELLQLPATDDMPSGMDLVRAKVRLWACMGGNFIGSPAKDDLKLGNNNFTVDKGSSYYALTHWPAPIMFVGREVASVPSGVQIGAHFAKLPADHPLRVGYELYFGGVCKDRHVADPATALFAVRGLGDYWLAHSGGFMDIREDMTFDWKDQPDHQQGYLLKKSIDGKSNDRDVEKALEELAMSPRRK